MIGLCIYSSYSLLCSAAQKGPGDSEPEPYRSSDTHMHGLSCRYWVYEPSMCVWICIPHTHSLSLFLPLTHMHHAYHSSVCMVLCMYAFAIYRLIYIILTHSIQTHTHNTNMYAVSGLCCLLYVHDELKFNHCCWFICALTNLLLCLGCLLPTIVVHSHIHTNTFSAIHSPGRSASHNGAIHTLTQTRAHRLNTPFFPYSSFLHPHSNRSSSTVCIVSSVWVLAPNVPLVCALPFVVNLCEQFVWSGKISIYKV